MVAITGPGTYTLPEPFDFDSIDANTVKGLGRTLYSDERILQTVEKPVGKQVVSITLWGENGPLSCGVLDKRFTECGLTPNPWHLVAFAKAQPDFADNRAIATQWKDQDGRFCCVVFQRWLGKRSVSVGRGEGWHGDSLFSGSRK